MPDMIQILFSEGRVTPSQPGKTHYSSSDTYSGEILLFTVYRPDGGERTPVDVVRSTITFETSACWGTSSSQNTSPSQADPDRIYYATSLPERSRIRPDSTSGNSRYAGSFALLLRKSRKQNCTCCGIPATRI